MSWNQSRDATQAAFDRAHVAVQSAAAREAKLNAQRLRAPQERARHYGRTGAASPTFEQRPSSSSATIKIKIPTPSHFDSRTDAMGVSIRESDRVLPVSTSPKRRATSPGKSAPKPPLLEPPHTKTPLLDMSHLPRETALRPRSRAGSMPGGGDRVYLHAHVPRQLTPAAAAASVSSSASVATSTIGRRTIEPWKVDETLFMGNHSMVIEGIGQRSTLLAATTR